MAGEAKGITADRLAQRSGPGAYIVFFVIISMIVFVVAKDVALPRSVTIPIALICLLALIYTSFAKPHIALLALAAYAPFSRAVTGQFGMEVVGLNLTNVMIIFILIERL